MGDPDLLKLLSILVANNKDILMEEWRNRVDDIDKGEG